MKRLLTLSLLLTTPCFAHGPSYRPHHHHVQPVEVLSAKDAREIILDDIRAKHSVAINWWIEFINAKIEKESRNGSACTLIDVTAASSEVQEYLVDAYDHAGYYQTELIPGWTSQNADIHFNRQPDGNTYISLSW